MNTKLLALAAVALLLTGCASSKMVNRADQTTEVPAADKAQVIFMRPSSFGGAVQASLFDVSSTDPGFIGIVSTGTQVSYMLDPGEHLFMVVSEAADFLPANLWSGEKPTTRSSLPAWARGKRDSVWLPCAKVLPEITSMSQTSSRAGSRKCGLSKTRLHQSRGSKRTKRISKANRSGTGKCGRKNQKWQWRIER